MGRIFDFALSHHSCSGSGRSKRRSLYRRRSDAQYAEQITTLPQPLAAGTGLFLDDRLLIFGGDDASTFHQVEELIAQASKMVAGAEQDSVIAQKNRLQRNHPGFPKSVWSLDLSSME